jgi:hypothetical protein
MGNCTDVMFCLQTKREGKRRRRGSNLGVHDHQLHGLHLRGDFARDQVRDDPVCHHGRRVLRRGEVSQQVRESHILFLFSYKFYFRTSMGNYTDDVSLLQAVDG